jgi:hypothetical protein
MKISACLSVAALVTAAVAAVPEPVSYPQDYRDWTHVKSMVIESGHPLHASFGGIHHLYANEAAMRGYRGGDFPDGAVIVFDLLSVESKDHAVTEGARKVVGVMRRDARRFAATGGWGFEAFAGDSRSERLVGEKAATACFACHQSQQAHGFVFSEYRP